MNKKYNDKQLSAINSNAQKILVVAGAGSGKTSVLVERAIYLIKEKKIHPQKIWLVTFTNQAVSEIKERMAFEDIHPPFISTFHSSFIKVLREHIQLIGWKQNFRIFNQKDKKNFILRKVKLLGLDKTLKDVVNLVSELKLYFLSSISFTEEEYQEFLSINYFQNASYSNALTIYKYYLEESKKLNVLDFDDIEIYTKQLFEFQEVKDYWSGYYDAILIDEFQDINKNELHIVENILSDKTSIFCVGDPDQSIYGFRGAEADVFEKFANKHTTSEIIKLEQNYRSTNNILKLSNELINSGDEKFDKKLYSNLGEGTKVKYFFANDPKKESYWIINEIKKLQKEENFFYSKIAILFRNKFNYMQMEQTITEEKIAYRVFGTSKLFDKIEIELLINYLNLIFFNSYVSLENLFSSGIVKGIGEALIEKMNEEAKRTNSNLYEMLFEEKNFSMLTTSAKEKVVEFIDGINSLKKNETLNKPISWIEKILEVSGAEEKWKLKDEKKRILNAHLFSEMLEDNFKNNMKETVAIMSTMSENSKQKSIEDPINFCTIHQSKGLEFEYVFLCGLSKGGLPSYHANTKKELAEEKRIAYVACTRAKKHLFLSGSPTSWINKHTVALDHESVFIKSLKKLDCLDLCHSSTITDEEKMKNTFSKNLKS